MNNRKHISNFLTLLVMVLLSYLYTVQYTHVHQDQHTEQQHDSKDLSNHCSVCQLIESQQTVVPSHSSIDLKAPEKKHIRSHANLRYTTFPKGFDGIKSNKDPPLL